MITIYNLFFAWKLTYSLAPQKMGGFPSSRISFENGGPFFEGG